MIVTFFGHAQFPNAKKYEQKVIEFFEQKIGDSSVDFYLGGYGDFDSFAYDCCKKYKETHINASLVFVTPYMTIEYQRNHLAYQKERYDEIVYPEIEDKPLRFAISYRNKWMVEHADYVICGISCDYGGAYKAYQYAKRKGKPIFNVTDKVF
ncbi:MAG: hypothetical protein J6Q78_00915 [Clostridia bacterium]|nr:hypothetical protein [Clostridia bacterium]